MRGRALHTLLAAAFVLVSAVPGRAQGIGGGASDPAMIGATRAAANRASAGAQTGSNAVRLPVPLPGPVDPKEYRLGPGDALVLTVWGRVDRADEVVVGPEGYLVVPDAGTIRVDGMTLEDARQRILAVMRSQLRNAQMDVRLARPRTFIVYVTGQIHDPGPTEANGTNRISDIVTEARMLANSSHRRIEILRRDGSRAEADLDLFLLTGDATLNPYLRDGDVLQVPVATEFIFANGALARPGRYELGPRDSLLTLLLLSGDPVPSASADRALLIRWIEPFRAESLWVKLGDAYSRTVNPALADGDRLYAFFVPRYHEQHEVVVSGEVARPGSYPIVAGITRLSDVVHAAEGFLPEADLSAIRVLRGNPSSNEKDPEFDRLLRLSRGELTSSEYEKLRTKLASMKEEYRVDWQRVQKEHSSLDLLMLNGDIVRVEKLVSSIRVDGEVRHPGILAFQAGLGVDDYIRKAGGYSDRAWHGKVRVTRSVTGQTLYAKDVPTLGPGDFVWVPEKPDRNYGQAGLTLLTVVASLATVALAIVTINQVKMNAPAQSVPTPGGFDLGKLVERVWAHRVRVVTATVAAGLLSLGIAFLMPKWYRSTAVILPPDDSDLLSNLSLAQRALTKFPTMGVLPDIFTPADIFKAILQSRTVQEDVIRAQDLQQVYHLKSMEKTLKKLKDLTRVKLNADGTISLSAEDRDPNRAAAIASSYLVALDRFNMEKRNTQAHRTRIFLERRVAEVDSALQSDEALLRAYQEKHYTVSPTSVGSGEVQAAADLLAHKIMLEVRLGVLRSYLNEDNEQVVLTKVELDQLKARIATLPALQDELGRIIRGVKIQEQLYLLLTSELEQSRIRETMDTPTVQVLDVPAPPERQSRPRRILLALGGAVLAFLGSVVYLAFTAPAPTREE